MTKADLFRRKAGIKLDVGCGKDKQKGFVGLDIIKHPKVDIIHDVQKFPWPVPNSVCFQILMSHLWEHIEPKYRFQLMDECWRICRHDGQLLISAPYANSIGAAAHPAHYGCPNGLTFTFFDPNYELFHATSYQQPKPWKIKSLHYSMAGTLELILEPRKHENGKAHKISKPTKNDIEIKERKDYGKKAEEKRNHRFTGDNKKRS